MDDFQHRLLVALERLAGREGAPTLREDMSAVILRLEVIEGRLAEGLQELIGALEEIRDQLAALAEGKPSGLP